MENKTINKIKIKDSVYDIQDYRIEKIDTKPTVDSNDPISSSAVASLKEEIDTRFDTIEGDTDSIHDILESKVDKVEGKALSTEDYSTEEKDKLAGIENDAQVNIIEVIAVNNINQRVTNKRVDLTIPTKLSDLGNGDKNHRLVTDAEKET